MNFLILLFFKKFFSHSFYFKNDLLCTFVREEEVASDNTGSFGSCDNKGSYIKVWLGIFCSILTTKGEAREKFEGMDMFITLTVVRVSWMCANI